MNHLVRLVVGLHVCAMDCNPRVQLTHICVHVEVWSAIPESKQVLFGSTRMIEPEPKKGGHTQKKIAKMKKIPVQPKTAPPK